LGSEAVWGLLALWLLRFGRTQRWESVVGLVLVWGGAELLNSGLKQLVRRARPQPVQSIVLGQEFSFPSGHAMVAAAFYSFLAHRSWGILCGWQRVVGAVGSLLLILLIGLVPPVPRGALSHGCGGRLPSGGALDGRHHPW
jgi:membrane-associated phospholipid phosphatase